MGNDLDLLGSHDVIGQVTIRFAICHFLLVILWNEQTSLSVFEYSAPFATHAQITHARYHVIL